MNRGTYLPVRLEDDTRRLRHRQIIRSGELLYMVVVDGGAKLVPHYRSTVPTCTLQPGEPVRVGTATYTHRRNSAGEAWLRPDIERTPPESFKNYAEPACQKEYRNVRP